MGCLTRLTWKREAELALTPVRPPGYRLTGARTREAMPMAGDNVTRHSVPEIVVNRDGPENRRVAFVDDYGGKIELSTQRFEI